MQRNSESPAASRTTREHNGSDDELETDARPGTRESMKQQYTGSKQDSKDSFITHDHGDGMVTKLCIAPGAVGHSQNIQIGSRNVMIVEDHSRKTKGKKIPKTTPSRHFTEVPNRGVSDADLDIVSSDIGKDCKHLCRQLGLGEIQIEQLYLDFKDEGLYEVMYQALRKWQKLGNASLSTLFKALQNIDREDIINKLGNS